MRCAVMSMVGRATYALDLRPKMLQAYARRLSSQRALADLCGVSLAWVEQLWRPHRTAGDIAPTPPAGGQRPSLDAAAHTRGQPVVPATSEMTCEARCSRVAEARGLRVRVATRCRVRQRLGFPRHNSRALPARATPRAA